MHFIILDDILGGDGDVPQGANPGVANPCVAYGDDLTIASWLEHHDVRVRFPDYPSLSMRVLPSSHLCSILGFELCESPL